MSVGMQLSVLCSEDAPRVTPADVAREATRARSSARTCSSSQLKACEMWPKGAVDAVVLRAGRLRRAGAGAVRRRSIR